MPASTSDLSFPRIPTCPGIQIMNIWEAWYWIWWIKSIISAISPVIFGFSFRELDRRCDSKDFESDRIHIDFALSDIVGDTKMSSRAVCNAIVSE